MRELDYRRPRSLEDAVKDLKRKDTEDAPARLIAGGTDLLGVMSLGIAPAYTVVSSRDLGLNVIAAEKGGISIGATSTLSDIARDAEIRRRAPLLAEAARSVASPQIRHVATIGGNICQEPRCWYYRYPDDRFHCMRKGGDLCNAMTGDNASHSTLGAAKVRVSPCAAECPNGTDIPAYLDALRRGDPAEAARIFMRVNPLGAVTGRVCPHSCQSSCNRGGFDEAVGIRDIERFVCDYALDHFDEVCGGSFVAEGSGKSVGVIGAGPAGLTAAWYLRRRGHAVTVYDRNDEIGGMLRYAIPAYRLPPSVIGRIREVYDRIGVSFVVGAGAQPDPARSANDLPGGHDAVLISCGAWADNEASFEGAEHALSGLSFLRGVREGDRAKPGDRVVVIGGGNVAVDAAVSARRLGCDVTILYRRSRGEMPAYDEEVEEALREGVRLVTNHTPLRIVTEGASVREIVAAACSSGGGRGAELSVDAADVTRIGADAVIMAIGQRVDASAFSGMAQTDARGRIAVFAESGATASEGVFAAGDVVTGPATVVEAIAGGRRAAYGIDEYLTGRAAGPSGADTDLGGELRFDPSCILPSARVKPQAVAAARRGLSAEDVGTLPAPDALTEAKRCFNCGCVAVTPSDLAPALVALGADVITTERRIAAEDFFRAGVGSSTVLRQGEIVTRIFVPDPPPGASQEYLKFRTRKAIDFPLASVASVIVSDGEKIRSARIVLGGAAPAPYRAKAAEEAAIGRPADGETAEAAGAMAVKDMVGLAEIAYKIRVFRALVRRAVAGAQGGAAPGPEAGRSARVLTRAQQRTEQL
jgi:NADPH-dependent glutamate synthase beta subunit-like oxidoreductase/CO/xanthine dehydrogenase FAD-binding subunit